MQHAALYDAFAPKVEEFAKFQGFIEKARAQSDKFAKNVIEKLVQKHTDSAMGVFEELLPILPDVEAAMSGLASQIDEVAGGREEHTFNLDVLRLTLEIGQIDQSEFDAASAATAAELERIAAAVGGLDEELALFAAKWAEWSEVAERSGITQ